MIGTIPNDLNGFYKNWFMMVNKSKSLDGNIYEQNLEQGIKSSSTIYFYTNPPIGNEKELLVFMEF